MCVCQQQRKYIRRKLTTSLYGQENSVMQPHLFWQTSHNSVFLCLRGHTLSSSQRDLPSPPSSSLSFPLFLPPTLLPPSSTLATAAAVEDCGWSFLWTCRLYVAGGGGGRSGVPFMRACDCVVRCVLTPVLVVVVWVDEEVGGVVRDSRVFARPDLNWDFDRAA